MIDFSALSAVQLLQDEDAFFLVSSAKNPSVYLMAKGVVHTVVKFDNPQRLYYHMKPVQWMHKNEDLRKFLHGGIFRFVNEKGKVVEEELFFDSSCDNGIKYSQHFHKTYSNLVFDVPASLVARSFNGAAVIREHINQQLLRYLQAQKDLLVSTQAVNNESTNT